MAVNPTQTDYDLLRLKTKNIRIKINVLNFNFQIINSLEGTTTEGSINIDANSDIRRTCSITLVAPKLSHQLIAPGGEIWIDKYIQIYVGTDNPKNNNETVWTNMGIFLINNPNTVYNINTKSITFEGIDLMAKLTNKRGGQLTGAATVVYANSIITNVVRNTLINLAGIKKYIIQESNLTVPYDLKLDMGSTIYDLLVKLRDLYPDWEFFFDTDGVFHWQQIPSGKNEPVILDFDNLPQSLILSDNVNVDFENVKNHIIVYGRLLDNGHQVYYHIYDVTQDSPFNINRIGVINYIVNDEAIISDELAQDRAKYELFLHTRMNDNIVLETVPIYWLNDVNIKIKYTNTEIGIEGEYLIKSLEIPLTIGNTMTINAIKLYEETEYIITANPEYPMVGSNWYTSNQNQFPYFV